MNIQVTCPSCQQTFSNEPQPEYNQVVCPHCYALFYLPGPPPSPATPGTNFQPTAAASPSLVKQLVTCGCVMIFLFALILIVTGLVMWFTLGHARATGNQPIGKTRTAMAASNPASIASTPADWTLSRFDAAGTNFNRHENVIGPANVANLEVLWSNRHSSSIRGYVSVVGETAFYGDYGGEFRAVKATTGKTIWKRRLSGKHQGHAVVGGVCYVSSIGQLFAFDAATGHSLWSKPPPASKKLGGLFLADNLLFVGSSSPSTLHAVEPTTGKFKWSIPGGGFAALDGVLYKTAGKRLQALDARTGNPLWETTVNAGNLGAPAVSDGMLYAFATTGKLYAFDVTARTSRNRAPLWVGKTTLLSEGDGPPAPAVGHGKVFLGVADTFYAFDTTRDGPSERNPVWKSTLATPFFASSPTVANHVVYSTAGHHDLFAFDVTTGKVLWKHHAPGREHPMRSKPTIVNGTLYHAATFGFTVYAFRVPEK